MSSPHSRSPSPPAQPPVQATPGPRATALHRLYDDAIAHIIRTCNYTNFSSCFPTPAAAVPKSMVQLHTQFTAKLAESMKRHFEVIVEERGVVGELNALDSLIEEARRRKKSAQVEAEQKSGNGAQREIVPPIPPHTLPAQRLYEVHVAPLLAQPLHEMQERQTNLEGENVELLSRVQQQRKEIESLMQGLEGAVADLESSVTRLQEGPATHELRAETRDAEEQMQLSG